ncbi:response regulator [Microvirga mediterraneensis]|uniref:Response regulator transcription factor n=1 Tax=Microvirga mediterraneensis TaxID=2754695 RepID=A0A838BTP9_9HYPH|nr:response regulator transcription factor [Microvirga mediterraneensis]
MAHRILVVDDDPHIREVICFALEKGGMATSIARDGKEALKRFRETNPDLIVLDIGMPEMDGLEVCRQIRKESDVPILFLSARDEEIDRILGLEIGGDDYVTKPFSPRELVTRVNVILRRTAAKDVLAPESKLLSQGQLSMDPLRHTVMFNGSPITLTAIEFMIVKSFLARPGIVLTREQIIDAAYSIQIYVSDRTIDSHIRNIRAKFTAAGCVSIIDTVHGVGFRLGLCEATL